MSKIQDLRRKRYAPVVPRPAATRRRPDRSKGDLREADLLDVAETLLRAGRFEDASISEIAAAAEISRPTFYFYFASKQSLLARLIETRVDELIALHWPRVGRRHDSPAEELRRTLHDVADMWIEHGVVFRTAAELSGNAPEVFDRIVAVIEAVVDDRAELLVEAGGTPEVADLATARETARTLLWMSERNFYVLSRRHGTEEEFHALAERLYRIWARVAGVDPS
jgi:AcrR family transcriptional regulator